jgi:hypothetical protein
MHANTKKFIRKVMSQLPGVPEPRILVRLPGFAIHNTTPEQEAGCRTSPGASGDCLTGWRAACVSRPRPRRGRSKLAA